MYLVAAVCAAVAVSVWDTGVADRLRQCPMQPQSARDGPWRMLRGKGVRGEASASLLERAGELDLFAACLLAGLTPARSAFVVAESTQSGHWAETATMLGLGVGPERAWAPLAALDGLAELAIIARSSHRSGAAMGSACRDLAARLLSQAETEAVSRSERASVLIAIPLAFFFLPAFFVLGLAPVVITLGRGVLPLQ